MIGNLQYKSDDRRLTKKIEPLTLRKLQKKKKETNKLQHNKFKNNSVNAWDLY